MPPGCSRALEKTSEYVSNTWIGAYFIRFRESKSLVLFIVAVALLLDNMLLTTVVPIIPDFLYSIRHPQDSLSEPSAGEHVRSTRGAPMPPTGVHWMGNLKSANDTPLSRHDELANENVEVGLMFASKAIVQLITNPFIGPITNRIGYSVPMFCGFVILFASTLLFALSQSYAVLVFARAVQGIGSSCSSVAGMSMLAQRYTDDKERGNAMGIALGGLALGVLIGPPFGGVMYQWFGKSMPFLILAGLALVDGVLQLVALKPSVDTSDEGQGPSLQQLLTDPYILIASGAVSVANMGIAMLEPSLPIFMLDTMGGVQKWQLGAAFLPASISYLLGTNVFGSLGHRIGRWLTSFIGLNLIAVSLVLVPFSTTVIHLVVPLSTLGFGIGMVDSTMMPELGHIVDLRHGSVYGSVYAIGDIAICLGYAVGPAVGGTLVKNYGFDNVMFGIAGVCVAFGPLHFYLRDPPAIRHEVPKETTQLVVDGMRTNMQYLNIESQAPDSKTAIAPRLSMSSGQTCDKN